MLFISCLQCYISSFVTKATCIYNVSKLRLKDYKILETWLVARFRQNGGNTCSIRLCTCSMRLCTCYTDVCPRFHWMEYSSIFKICHTLKEMCFPSTFLPILNYILWIRNYVCYLQWAGRCPHLACCYPHLSVIVISSLHQVVFETPSDKIMKAAE